jgi:hypothetical protein
MLRAALIGRQGHFETRVEARLDEFENRLPQRNDSGIGHGRYLPIEGLDRLQELIIQPELVGGPYWEKRHDQGAQPADAQGRTQP